MLDHPHPADGHYCRHFREARSGEWRAMRTIKSVLIIDWLQLIRQ